MLEDPIVVSILGGSEMQFTQFGLSSSKKYCREGATQLLLNLQSFPRSQGTSKAHVFGISTIQPEKTNVRKELGVFVDNKVKKY